MASTATVIAQVTVNDTVKDTVKESVSAALSVAITPNGKREPLALVLNTFLALSPPTGAKWLLLLCQAATGTVTLKGVTGDTGITIMGGAVAGCPLLIPLTGTPSIGLLSTTSQTIEAIWG